MIIGINSFDELKLQDPVAFTRRHKLLAGRAGVVCAFRPLSGLGVCPLIRLDHPKDGQAEWFAARPDYLRRVVTKVRQIRQVKEYAQ